MFYLFLFSLFVGVLTGFLLEHKGENYIVIGLFSVLAMLISFLTGILGVAAYANQFGGI